MTEEVKPIPTGQGNADDNGSVTDQFKTAQKPEQQQGTPPPTTAERKAAADAKAEADKAAQEAVEGKATEEEEHITSDDDAELDTSAWGDVDTSDEVTYSTLQLLQNSGVKPEEAKAMLWDAVEAGDLSKIDRDALVEKVGKAKATLILNGVKTNIDDTKRKIAEVSKVVHTEAGSEDNWVKARTWAVKNIPESELNEYRDMLDKGGNAAKFAAREIVSKYNGDPKNTSLNVKRTITGDGKGGGSKLEPLSRREYGLALDRAHSRRASQAELNTLLARRNLGKQKGI